MSTTQDKPVSLEQAARLLQILGEHHATSSIAQDVIQFIPILVEASRKGLLPSLHGFRVSRGLQGRSDEVVIFSNGREFFRSTDADQKKPAEQFTRSCFTLPMRISPRQNLPTGCVKTVGDLLRVFFADQSEIVNPDAHYQPK